MEYFGLARRFFLAWSHPVKEKQQLIKCNPIRQPENTDNQRVAVFTLWVIPFKSIFFSHDKPLR